jgi:hypothetical protein
MIFIYGIDLQEEAPMDKKHDKRGNKEYTGYPILIYMTFYRNVNE